MMDIYGVALASAGTGVSAGTTVIRDGVIRGIILTLAISATGSAQALAEITLNFNSSTALNNAAVSRLASVRASQDAVTAVGVPTRECNIAMPGLDIPVKFGDRFYAISTQVSGALLSTVVEATVFVQI